jgi:hypothetical protein
MARLPWFEDFNDHAIRPPPEAEEPRPPPDEAPDPRTEAWTEGFLAGCRAGDAESTRQSRGAAAELCRRVAAIEHTLAAIADQSAATVGLLLLDVLTAALPPGWPADRLAAIVAAIRPIFALEPRLHISPAVEGELPLHDLPALAEAMQVGNRELVVRWHSPAGDNDPADLAGAVRQAISPEASRSPSPAEHAKSVPPNPDEG